MKLEKDIEESKPLRKAANSGFLKLVCITTPARLQTQESTQTMRNAGASMKIKVF